MNSERSSVPTWATRDWACNLDEMRRSFASNRVSAGVSIEKVANWLGDSTAVAWTNYSRFPPVIATLTLGLPDAGGRLG